MSKLSHKQALLERRKRRVRGKISGTAARPRLSVRRSLNHIYAQVIDDVNGVTLAEASSVSLKIKGGNVDAAKQVGAALGERVKAKAIETIAMDRGGRRYHGRVKALADAVREAGLKF